MVVDKLNIVDGDTDNNISEQGDQEDYSGIIYCRYETLKRCPL